MAYSKEQWERAKAYWEAGQHNPREISEKVGIERSTIVKRAKSHNWNNCENSDYIDAKMIIATKKSQLNSQTLDILDDIAETKIRRANLVFGGMEKLAKLTNTMIDKNQTVEKINCGDGMQNFEPRELNTADLKNIASTLTDVGKALGVIESGSAININNANNQQTNNEAPTIVFKRIGNVGSN